MNTTEYLSLEKEVFLSDKQKLKPEYFKELGEHYISSLETRKHHIHNSRNYYAGIRDLEDFEYLEDIYGMQNPIDLSFTNIIKPRVDALVGLSLMSEPDFSVAYNDSNTIKKVEKEKMQKTLEELNSKLGLTLGKKRQLRQESGGKNPPQRAGGTIIMENWLKNLTRKYGENYQSTFQVAAQHIINLIESDSEIDLANIKKEVAKDYFITGEMYTREIYPGDGRDPKKVHIRPEELFTNRPIGDKDLKNTDVFVHRRRMTVHNVLKELGEKISKEDAERLFSAYSSLSYSYDLPYGAPDVMVENHGGEQLDVVAADALKTGWSNGPLNRYGRDALGDMVDFYHVEWLASTRIPDGKGGHVYREDRYEVYRVGAELYVGGRRCDEAPRTEDALWKTTSSYTGAINTSSAGNIESMVENMREVQDLYDILMFFRNNLVANSGVSGSRVNVAAIPKALGKKFMERMEKWITIRKQGLELIDPTEEGAQLFQHYGDFDAAIRGDGIQAVNAILESLVVQADITSGVPRQMLGVIEQRDAVENVKVGINQVSVLSLELFREVDRLLARGIQKTLDNFKYAYRNKKLKGVYKNGTAIIPFTIMPEHISTTDFKVNVISSGIENAKLVKVMTLAKEFASAGAIAPDVLVKIVNKRSVEEIEHILSQAIQEQQEKMQNLQTMQQQLEEAGTQINQLQAEIDRLNNNAQAQEKEALELKKKVAASEEALKTRELDITEKKNKEDAKQGNKDLAIKKDIVELEKNQLIFGSGKEKEVKNNFS